MSNFKYLAVLVLAISILLVSCGSTETLSTESEEPIHLKVHISNYLSVTPIYIAHEEGYFAEQNLEIEFVTLENSEQVVPLLASGQVDVSAAALTTGIINAIVRDQNIRVVAERGSFDPDGCTYSAILIPNDALESGRISDPSDLAGQPVRSTATGPTAFFFDAVLRPYGLSIDDTNLVNLPAPNVGVELSSGSIAAAAMVEPFVSSIVENGEAQIWYRAEEVIPEAVYGVLIYGNSILQNNREAGNRFMVAYLKGVRQYNEGKTEQNLQFFHDFTQLDFDVIESSCLPSINPDGRINFELGLDRFQQWALEKGHIDAALTREEFFDDSFVEYANQALGENAP